MSPVCQEGFRVHLCRLFGLRRLFDWCRWDFGPCLILLVIHSRTLPLPFQTMGDIAAFHTWRAPGRHGRPAAETWLSEAIACPHYSFPSRKGGIPALPVRLQSPTNHHRRNPRLPDRKSVV